MAWITTSFRSQALKMPVEAEILVPQPGYKRMAQAENYKVIVLLHGANNDRTEWLLKSQIYDFVKELPVLVFMPSGKNSFYINTANGYDYMDYIIKEIPEFLKTHFRVSKDRRDWLIAGESMGGYGAAVCGLHGRQQFGYMGVFSGALDIESLYRELRVPAIYKEIIFGDDVEKMADSSYNVLKYCHQVPECERPKVFLCCGMQDRLYPMTVRFCQEIKEGYDVTYSEGEGNHDFLYWNERLKEMLTWFLQDEKEVQA